MTYMFALFITRHEQEFPKKYVMLSNLFSSSGALLVKVWSFRQAVIKGSSNHWVTAELVWDCHHATGYGL